jgi:aspartyl-tRNA(Asn)/glutamyl-tRNA(Gln) amidotransferase subunit A
VRTTAGSAVFKDRIPSEDATVVLKLKEAGAVLLGKLNMHEFAYGATSVTSYYGPVANPWAAGHIAGGSSGGSAAAVAAGLCYAALGSDTGGSIREPASFCGIVGLMATYGRVSNRGVIPLSWSLDHIGPMTRFVTDAALVLQAIAGYDLSEPTSQDRPIDHYVASAWRKGSRLRIGIPRAHFYTNLHPEVETGIEEALTLFKKLGAEIQDVPLEVSKDRVVIRAEAYAYHSEHIVSTPELYQPETLGKLRLGQSINAETYINARRELDRLRRVTPGVFSSVDVLITPTTPVTAPRAADLPSNFDAIVAGEGVLLQNDRPFDINGLPCVSVPCGTTRAGLPIGLQISGPPWGEAQVLSVARAFEQATHAPFPRVT